jgi:hypothetical protein
MATIFTTNNNNKDNKIAILLYFFINISVLLYCCQTTDFHLPDDRAASPFYPPLPPTVTGWLLCESLSNSGRLMP